MSNFKHVIHNIDRVPKDLVQAVSRISTATLHEAYDQKGAFCQDIRPIRLGMKLCGPVVTVQSRPGDNIMAHKAIYTAEPGDILLVDTGSFVEGGFWGEIMAEAAKHRQIGGLVTNGSVRDTDEIDQIGFPVFSKGISIKGTTKDCLGTVNHPLVFSGMHVNPGDLIAADADGVVVIKKEDVAGVLEKAFQRDKKEKRFIEEIRSGKSTLDLFGLGEKLDRLGIKE